MSNTSRGSHVDVDGLSHRYGLRGITVLQDINLTIPPGQRVALVGRSGCGKSTLLQLLAGLVRPTSGSIRIDGTLVKGPSPRWNVMFQRPSLYPWMTVKKNASLGMLIAGDHQLALDRVPKLLQLVGLEEYADTNVQQLSGGQQQRVALARSLATHPELLMLDEPFSALDEVTRRELQHDVTRITKQFEITQILVTHDIDEAALMAERILVMASSPGKIVADLTNDQADEQHVRVLKETIRDHLEGESIAENSTFSLQTASN